MADKITIGSCPACSSRIDWKALSHQGIIRGRPQSRGGPYFSLRCPACGDRLIAEGGEGRIYSYSRQRNAPGAAGGFGAALGTALRWMFGKPAATDDGPRPSARRARHRAEYARRQAEDAESGRGRTESRPSPREDMRLQLDVLGLPVEATLIEVKARYRQLVKQWHPDVFAGADGVEQERARDRFVTITDAYREVLEAWRES